MDDLMAIIAIVMGCGIPMTAIWTQHQRKIMEMKLQMRNQGDSGLRAEVESLRQEIRSLRDTSMQYDLSFDTALQRMEKRVEGLERRTNGTTSEPPVVNLGMGR